MSTALRLQTREARKNLPKRSEPYWLEIRRGRYIGYRRGATGGFWLLREHCQGMGKKGAYIKRRLGPADDDGAGDGVLSWDDARKLADGEDRPTVTVPGRYTVAQAAEAYFATRSATGEQDEHTFAAFVAPKLGRKPVAELTTGDIEAWLAAQVPATADREARRAAQATANRRFNVLRAILNSAFRKDPARVPSDTAWRRVRGFQKTDRPRTRTLTAEEARRLLNALPQSLRALARGALYTGCRLGELQALTVADVADGQVTIQHSKSGRSRVIPLSADGVTFFEQTTAGKAGDARLFDPVTRIGLSRAMRAACGWRLDRKANEWRYDGAAGKISPPATFHDLRRSYGSLLLNSGASAEVIQELLGHADLRMTRRAYAHLLQKTLQRAVKKHLPTFGLEPSNVKPFASSDKKGG
jgi:integrase